MLFIFRIWQLLFNAFIALKWFISIDHFSVYIFINNINHWNYMRWNEEQFWQYSLRVGCLLNIGCIIMPSTYALEDLMVKMSSRGCLIIITISYFLEASWYKTVYLSWRWQCCISWAVQGWSAWGLSCYQTSEWAVQKQV